MKQWPVFFLLILMLASCSSFSRMKYGHVKKVPAEPVAVAVAAQSSAMQDVILADTELIVSVAKVTEKITCPDSVIAFTGENAGADSMKMQPQPTELRLPLRLNPELPLRLQLHTELPLQLPLNTDRVRDLPSNFQLFFGAMFLLGGIALLLVSVFFMPYLPWPWLFILLAEIAALFTAWRMIRRGIAFLRAHFGNRRSYQEN